MAGKKRTSPRSSPAANKRRPAPQPGQAELLPAAQAETALSPEQRRYKQLCTRIEKARAELRDWDTLVPPVGQAHLQRMRPLLQEMTQVRLGMARKLDNLLGERHWRAADRGTLRRAVAELALELIGAEFVDEAAEAELKTLHARHAKVSLQDEQRAALQGFRQTVEDITGLDLSDLEFESEEDMREQVQQRLHQRAQQQQAHGHADPQDPLHDPQHDEPRRRGSKPGSAAHRKQQARLEKQAQEAEQASKSVREVYRKLASALHPDRAEDQADQARRTALMQRVNQAYAAQDLLGLFALQLEIEQIDPDHLARASSERLRHYNRVLASQLDELQEELLMRAESFSLHFGIDEWVKLNPRRLEPLLEGQLCEIRADLGQLRIELRILDHPASARRWVKQMRVQHQLEDEFDAFELPF